MSRNWRRINQQRVAFFNKYERDFRVALKKQIGPLLDEIKKISNPEQLEIRAEGFIDETPIEKTFVDLYKRVGVFFAAESREGLKSTGGFETKDEELEVLKGEWYRFMESYALNEAGGRITAMTEESKRLALKYIRESITEANAEGWGVEKTMREMRKNLATNWGEMSRWRSRRIAQTEIIGASNRGAYKGAESSGIEMVKNWLIGGGNTRDTHLEANVVNQKIPMNQPFICAGIECDCPGDVTLPPEEVINCHCAVSFDPV